MQRAQEFSITTKNGKTFCFDINEIDSGYYQFEFTLPDLLGSSRQLNTKIYSDIKLAFADVVDLYRRYLKKYDPTDAVDLIHNICNDELIKRGDQKIIASGISIS